MIKFSDNKNIDKFINILFLIIGLAVMINAVVATIKSGLGLGVILTYVFALVMLFNSISTETIGKLPIILTGYFFVFIFVLLLAYSNFVYSYGGEDNVTYEEDALIVLGTTVIGNQPSADLKSRLDATIEYSEKNSDVLIVVTGGQGNDENESEAYVMKKYLVEAGISEDKVIMEDLATSTVENFKYSTEIIKAALGDQAQVAYISNDFHIFRAGILAKNAGIENATHYHGNTPWYMIIPNGLRESIVTAKMWLID